MKLDIFKRLSIFFILFGILFIPNFLYATTLLTDNFTGTVIDQTKWNLVSGTEGVDFIQNGNLNVRNSGTNGAKSVNSINTFARGDDLTISANVTNSTGSGYLGYGDYNYTNGSSNAYYIIIHSSLGYDAYIRQGGAIYSSNTSCGSYTAGAKVSLKVTSNSFQVYKSDVLQCSVTVDGSAILITNKSVFLQGSSTGTFFDDVLVANSLVAPVNTVPAAITNLAASQWGNTTTNLTWTAPSNGGDPITDYTVDYRISGNVSWTNFNDGVSASTGATVTGLTNGVTYEFRVRAINGVGTANDSNIASVTVLAPQVPSTPSAPTAVTILDINGQKASVSFSAPSANGSTITSYTVTSSPGNLSQIVSSSPATFSNLTNGISYTFTITATNGVGTSSASASSNSITTSAFPVGQATWTQQNNSGQRVWYDIASSSDGSKLSAVVNNGYIYTSTDSGVTWTQQNNSGQRVWYDIASSSDGSKLAATVQGGYIYTSTDSGVTWTQQNNSGQRVWTDITSSADGVYLVATTNTGTVYYSTNSGINWNLSTTVANTWQAVSSSSDGSKVYIGSSDASSSFVDYSINYGNYFDSNSASGNKTWSALANSSDGSKVFAAVTNGYIYTSNNSASSWSERTSSGQYSWASISSSSDGSKVIASSLSGYVFISKDGGVSWSQETTSANWRSVAISSDGSKVFAVNDNGYIYTGTIDIIPPTITNISSDKANGSYTIGEVIDIDVTFSENVTSTGNVTVTLETGTIDRTCTFSISNSTTGTCNYTVQSGDTTSDLTVNTISGTIADQSSNAMSNFVPATNLAANKAIVIDTTAPVISELTPVTSPTNDTTPDYTFTTNEAGSINYGGSCSSVTINAIIGSNTITLNTLTPGTYTNCTITITDSVSNVSNILNITSFTINSPISIVTPGAVSVAFLQKLSDRLRAENEIKNLNNKSCVKFLNLNSSLKLNSNNIFVKTLQQILNCKGYVISISGAGSKGKETTLFGQKTKDALIKFQKANNLKGDGILGPNTIKILNN